MSRCESGILFGNIASATIPLRVRELLCGGVHFVDTMSDSRERRFVTVGMGLKARVLVVVCTWRGDRIRIISARPAEPHEREEYEAQL
jgi:uncharacterized DUF497 family protein